jgi:type I restriction enzyme R subunit
LRIAFYKAAANYLRAYADLAQHLAEAGYTPDQAQAIEGDANHYNEVRSAIKNHAGEEMDIKPYEADMRHLINTYIRAEDAHTLGDLDTLSLTDLIIKTGVHDAIAKKLNEKGKLSNKAVAEGIINNIRKTIIRDQLTDPRYYEQMSKLLVDLIEQRRDDTESYEAFLRNAENLAKQLDRTQSNNALPAPLIGKPEAAVLFNNLPSILAADILNNVAEEPTAMLNDEIMILAIKLDKALKTETQSGWRGDQAKESVVLNTIHRTLGHSREATQAVFDIVKNLPGY